MGQFLGKVPREMFSVCNLLSARFKGQTIDMRISFWTNQSEEKVIIILLLIFFINLLRGNSSQEVWLRNNKK